MPLLVIDDFGLKPLRAPQDEDFHDLVAERYERGATVVTSNLDFSEWGDAFPNRLLGAATLDRLRHGAYRLTPGGRELSLSQAHARAPQTNRCHRSKEREIITPSGTPDQHPWLAPLTRTWVAPLGRSATTPGFAFSDAERIGFYGRTGSAVEVV